MENEELAALRATLLAAERLPAEARKRDARLCEQVAGGHELLPYVLAPSCSDPRDRRVQEDMHLLRILESGGPSLTPLPPRARYEPPPVRPGVVVLTLLALSVVLFLLHGLLTALFMVAR